MTAHALREGAHAAGPSAGDLSILATSSWNRPSRRGGGETKPDSRSSNRAVSRVLKKGAVLREAYIAEVPTWDHEQNRQVMTKLKVMPPHESLHALIQPGAENEWCSFDDSQEGFRTSLHDWGAGGRVGCDIMTSPWACLALWGDSAPYSKTDSLYLLTIRVLNGVHRRRIWIAALRKKNLRACGCYGRHTFDALFEIVAWSMKAFLHAV